MRELYYIGYYGGDRLKTRDVEKSNLAGTVKMNFVIQCIRKLGYKVNVISLAADKTPGYHSSEIIQVDELETHIYLPYFGIKIGGRTRGQQSAVFYLKRYLKKHLSKKSIVISYHSLGYGQVISELHKKIGFRWCPQIEEIYCLSRGELKDPDYLVKEEKMFLGGDGYLFVNDLLPEKYAKGKPYAVSYGNYHVFSENVAVSENNVNLVYTGIINSDRGAFLLLDAMQHLPMNYQLNILGFGTDENMKRFISRINELNCLFGVERIRFYGTRSGKDYSDFLIQNQIGISLMDNSEDISVNAFPSKIMAYLGHSLYVVSSKTQSIQKSKVASMLYFCDNTPKSVAKAVLSIPVKADNHVAENLRKLENSFIDDLRKVIEG